MTTTLPLRRVAQLVNGGTPTSDEANWGGEVPWATPVDLARIDGGYIAATDRTLTEAGLRQGSATVPQGALVLSTRAPIGYVALAGKTIAFNQGCKGLVPTAGTDGRFLRYWLTASRDNLQSAGSGSTFMELSGEALMSFPVPAQTPVEQRRIADYLDDQVARIDNIIAARDQQAAAIEKMRTAALTETFLAADLESVPLSHVAFVDHGRQRSPENAHGDDMTRYVRSANVTDGLIDTVDVLEMNFTPQEQQIYGLRAGDVLVTEASGSPDAIGASSVWRGQLAGTVCFQNHLLRLRARDHASKPEYLGWWARTSYYAGAMKVWATGANILNLGSASLRRMPVPVRSMTDQADTVARCNEIDRDCAMGAIAVTRQAALMSELKRSLITAAVTGEFDVWSADGSRVLA